MFRDAKVGDRVWSFSKGWGEISRIEPDIIYCIIVDFGSIKYDFTVDGKIDKSNINPTLFWDEIKFEIPEKPRWKPKNGETYYVISFSTDANIKSREFVFDSELSNALVLHDLAFKTKEEADLFHDKVIELAKNFNQ